MKLDSEIDELFDLVYNYTIQFAQANGFETDTISEVAENNKVINLIDYLNFQKQYIVLMQYDILKEKFTDSERKLNALQISTLRP